MVSPDENDPFKYARDSYIESFYCPVKKSSKIFCDAFILCQLPFLSPVLTLLPVITKIINLTLWYGIFSEKLKCALVHPLLKKLGLELIFQNLRPVSNLQYISKFTENTVFIQTHGQMVTNNIYPEVQSPYRQHHSTDTALLKVMNDVLLKINSQHVTQLILLDLSAAFNSVDHSIWLDRLIKVVGFQGKAHDWFRSYLSGRSQQVAIDGSMSMEFSLDCLPQVHCYANDTQLYLSFRPGDDVDQDAAHPATEAA